MNDPIAFATSDEYPNLPADDQPLFEQLLAKGLAATPVIWSSPDVNWADFAAIVIRSTWDYQYRLNEFRQWLHKLKQLNVKVWNPVDTLLWNLDKRYLQDLESRGVPVVPTTWVRQNANDILSTVGNLSRGDYVIKPAVAAGARETHRIASSNQQLLIEVITRIAKDSDVMIQPFCHEILIRGELSLIFFHGSFSHAVVKTPKKNDFRINERHGGQTNTTKPPPEALSLARSTLQKLNHSYLYARVDLVPFNGSYRIGEVELTEPSLFFMHSNGTGPQRFIEALIQTLDE